MHSIVSKQFGFKNDSTTDALLCIQKTTLNDIKKKKKAIIIITLDLFKAFDSVGHNLLLLKLFMIGCDLISMKWFKSYLSNWSQAVLHKESLSRFMSINLGVFQGSILGPLLFYIFINDLSRLDLKKLKKFSSPMTVLSYWLATVIKK
jgi:retron-type reverse transcriptase